MLEYLVKKNSFNRTATRLFEWLNRKKKATSEEEFSTYGVGMHKQIAFFSVDSTFR